MEVQAYLFFAGRCEEALAHYQRCIGGKVVTMMRYEGSPMDTPQLPPEWKQKVMHSTFDTGSTQFMASDAMPGQPAPDYTGFSLSLNIPKDAEKAKQVFTALAEGGQVRMPMDKTFWGAYFGMCTDRFGVPWMVNCDL